MKSIKQQVIFDGVVHYVCRTCEGVYPHDQFYARKDGNVHSYCRKCNTARVKEYRDEGKVPHIVLGTPEEELYYALTLQDLGL